MASEKAAAEFQLEKEINRAQEAQVCLLVLYTFSKIIIPFLLFIVQIVY